jgi:preprotein translocase subunit SecD
VRNHDDEQSAICSSDVAFSLHGKKATLTEVRLKGNVLSLSGTGEMDLENLNLYLQLSTQLTAISVAGQLGNLSVQPIALPRLQQALQMQQEGQQNSRPVMDFFKNAGNNLSKLNPIR